MLHNNKILYSYFIYLLIPCLLLYHLDFVEAAGEPNTVGGSAGKQIAAGNQGGEHSGYQGERDSRAQSHDTATIAVRPSRRLSLSQIVEAEQSGMSLFPPTNVAARPLNSSDESTRRLSFAQMVELEQSGMPVHPPPNVAALQPLEAARLSEGQIHIEKDLERRITEFQQKIDSRSHEILRRVEEWKNLVTEKEKLKKEHKKFKDSAEGRLEVNEVEEQRQLHEESQVEPQQRTHQKMQQSLHEEPHKTSHEQSHESQVEPQQRMHQKMQQRLHLETQQKQHEQTHEPTHEQPQQQTHDLLHGQPQQQQRTQQMLNSNQIPNFNQNFEKQHSLSQGFPRLKLNDASVRQIQQSYNQQGTQEQDEPVGIDNEVHSRSSQHEQQLGREKALELPDEQSHEQEHESTHEQRHEPSHEQSQLLLHEQPHEPPEQQTHKQPQESSHDQPHEQLQQTYQGNQKQQQKEQSAQLSRQQQGKRSHSVLEGWEELSDRVTKRSKFMQDRTEGSQSEVNEEGGHQQWQELPVQQLQEPLHQKAHEQPQQKPHEQRQQQPQDQAQQQPIDQPLQQPHHQEGNQRPFDSSKQTSDFSLPQNFVERHLPQQGIPQVEPSLHSQQLPDQQASLDIQPNSHVVSHLLLQRLKKPQLQVQLPQDYHHKVGQQQPQEHPQQEQGNQQIYSKQTPNLPLPENLVGRHWKQRYNSLLRPLHSLPQQVAYPQHMRPLPPQLLPRQQPGQHSPLGIQPLGGASRVIPHLPVQSSGKAPSEIQQQQEQPQQEQGNQQIYSNRHSNFPLASSDAGQGWQQQHNTHPTYSLPPQPAAHSQHNPGLQPLLLPRQISQLQPGQLPVRQHSPIGNQPREEMINHSRAIPLLAQMEMLSQSHGQHQSLLQPQLQTSLSQQPFHEQSNIYPQQTHLMQQPSENSVGHTHQLLSGPQESISPESIHHAIDVMDENSVIGAENISGNTSKKGKRKVSEKGISHSSANVSTDAKRRSKLMREAMASSRFPFSLQSLPTSESSNLAAILPVQQQPTMMIEFGVKRVLKVDVWRTDSRIDEFWVTLMKANYKKFIVIGTRPTEDRMAKFEILPEWGINEREVLIVAVGLKKYSIGQGESLPKIKDEIIVKHFRFFTSTLYIMFPYTDEKGHLDEITCWPDTTRNDQPTAIAQTQGMPSTGPNAQHHVHRSNSLTAQYQEVNIDDFFKRLNDHFRDKQSQTPQLF